MKNHQRFLLFFGALSLLPLFSLAEPWISNRFAQNCAACHAPGRMNLPAQGRRCTLSCQGCHVSPQGGGMRNQYGKWNDQRWLRSGFSKILKDKYTPARLEKQSYHRTIKKLAQKHGPKKSAKNRKSAERKLAQRSRKKRRRLKKKSKMVVTSNLDLPESTFDKDSYSEWKINLPTKKEFESIVPVGDPYWLERELDAYVGGGLRYLYGDFDYEQGKTKSKKKLRFLMAADLGARFRPTQFQNTSLVLEARFLNSSTNSKIDEGFTSGARVKSAYLLVDDLFYNSFVQAGYYRPMFGHYTPDHTTLAQKIAGFDQGTSLKAIGFGAAPNVPFFVFNYIMDNGVQTAGRNRPSASDNNNIGNGDTGFVLTSGARFVTYSLNAGLSYWNTTAKDPTTQLDITKNLISFHGGGKYKRYILNFDFLRADFKRADSNSVPYGNYRDAGNVYTIENKFRIWRETYALFNYASANTTSTLSQGSSNEMAFGVKYFPVAGWELEMLYENTEDAPLNQDKVKISGLQFQINGYF